MTITTDDLADPRTRALLALHLAGMHANSPPGAVFALDLSGLQDPAVTVWTLWDGEDVVGVVALKELGGGLAELKSMRTHPDHLRRGIGARMLDHVMGQARDRGLRRLGLETGRGPAFEPALALYRSRGFTDGPAFAAYEAGTFSQFLHLDL